MIYTLFPRTLVPDPRLIRDIASAASAASMCLLKRSSSPFTPIFGKRQDRNRSGRASETGCSRHQVGFRDFHDTNGSGWESAVRVRLTTGLLAILGQVRLQLFVLGYNTAASLGCCVHALATASLVALGPYQVAGDLLPTARCLRQIPGDR